VEFKDFGGNFDQQQVEDIGFGRLRHRGEYLLGLFGRFV